MRAVKSVTVVLPAYQVTGAMASMVRDLAVATSALRSRGIDLDVLLLHDGQDDVAAISTRAADDLGLSPDHAPRVADRLGRRLPGGLPQGGRGGPRGSGRDPGRQRAARPPPSFPI